MKAASDVRTASTSREAARRVAPASSISSTSSSGKPAIDGRVLEMKIRLAHKILRHQPENDPVGHRFNKYWVGRWKKSEDFPQYKLDHRIGLAISLTTTVYNRYLKRIEQL